MATSPVGQQEKLLQQLLTGILRTRPQSRVAELGSRRPIQQQLFRTAIGQPTPAALSLFNRQMGEQNANILEAFGTQGARYGSDLANVLARQGEDSRLAFQNMLQERSQGALNQILNLGGQTAGFAFQRGESALERALREMVARIQAQTQIAGLLGGLVG